MIEGLSGALPAGYADGERRLATGTGLGQYLQQRVSSYPGAGQTPDCGAFELDDRGEINALHVKVGSAEKAHLQIPTQSFTAWVAYSEGFDARDKGDVERARAQFAKALAADPSYAAAKSDLERLGVAIAAADRGDADDLDAELSALDPRSPTFATKVEELLINLDSADADESTKETKLLTWLGQHELLACPRTSGPAPENPHFLINDVPYGGVISHCRQVHEVLRIAEDLVEDPAT